MRHTATVPGFERGRAIAVSGLLRVGIADLLGEETGGADRSTGQVVGGCSKDSVVSGVEASLGGESIISNKIEVWGAKHGRREKVRGR